MCGIAGWVAESAEAPEPGALTRMLGAIAHRGPDDQGSYHHRNARDGRETYLGHRRLAIIDPLGGHQPMRDVASGLALVYNGEIYNFRELRTALAANGHRFSTDSDTEVLLRGYQHWGPGVVRRLRGMFAFALWDSRADRLVLARDRFGEKPLFLHRRGNSLYFASEIKALLALPGFEPAVDVDAIWDYLLFRYVPGPATLFRDVRKLQPGMTAVWEHGRLTESCYWSPPDGEAGPDAVPAGQPVRAFLSLLDDAVRQQMVSDAPFGAFLSGGLDSATIVALMSRHQRRVSTFSVGFGEDRYSELPFAADVAHRFGTSHHEIIVSHRDVIERLPDLVRYRDAPVSEPSDVAVHLLAREAARTVKMVLTGEGSDEILGGYPKHVVERFAERYRRLPSALRRLVVPLARALPYGFRRVKTAIANLEIEDRRERHVRWFGALSLAERDRLAAFRASDATAGAAAPDGTAPGAGALRRILHFDQTRWLPDNLLERADRMTMAASIEARVPFLDHRLAEFVSALPDRYRVRGLRGKWILREAARGLIPERVRTRPKVGFRAPVNEWFRGSLREYLLEHLQGARSRTRGYYDAAVLDRYLDEHCSGRHNHEKLLWTLLNLEIWHRQYL
ncbi:MAG: asparagine synthase (glutamine-hydrolyzing) [Steroidobacteraceae bacterium]